MNTNECRLKIREIWEPLMVPSRRLIKYQGSWPEAQVEIFEGKKYDEVDVGKSSHDCSALNYFVPEARFYYLGSYLIFTNNWAEDVINGTLFVFWDERIVHALNVLEAEIAVRDENEPVTVALAGIHEYFISFSDKSTEQKNVMTDVTSKFI